eukprot:TRINITY_DN4222_c0_g2_i1.p1 TRINITY_DN4222_c0_g2~~TRINITY_DN4222_c0_g2_i1.p1  ORF type:complete len:109 (+),score=5.29 TRINITY_DN4222_c0_g2_i1:76-402(+)
MSSKYEQFKIQLVGDTVVGKSCFLLRFCERLYTDHCITANDCDIRTIHPAGKNIKLKVVRAHLFQSPTTIMWAHILLVHYMKVCFILLRHPLHDSLFYIARSKSMQLL